MNASTLLTDDKTIPRLLHSFIHDRAAFRISSSMLKMAILRHRLLVDNETESVSGPQRPCRQSRCRSSPLYGGMEVDRTLVVVTAILYWIRCWTGTSGRNAIVV